MKFQFDEFFNTRLKLTILFTTIVACMMFGSANITMFDDRNQNKIIGFIEFIVDVIGKLIYFFIWIPISWIFKLLGNFVKDVATGVYGKIVQATVVVVFGLIVYFFQSHIK